MQADIENALSRSAVYTALSMALGPPDEEVAQRVASVEGRQQLREAFEFLGVECAGVTGATASLEDLELRYARLFGHTTRGEVTPYETEYGKESVFLQPHELADLGGFLSAFGLQLEPSRHERIDHIQCECEFMALLAGKEAYALEVGDEEMLEETRKAQRIFLRDHLGRFAPAFGTQLGQADGEGFFGDIGRMVARFVKADCDRLEVPVGPEGLGIREIIEDETPMACGTADCGPEECPS